MTGRQEGAKTYADEDIDFLLNLIEQMLPISNANWVELSRRYNSLRTEPREWKNLKKKFYAISYLDGTNGSEHRQEQINRAVRFGAMIKHNTANKIYTTISDETVETDNDDRNLVAQILSGSSTGVLEVPASVNAKAHKVKSSNSAETDKLLQTILTNQENIFTTLRDLQLKINENQISTANQFKELNKVVGTNKSVSSSLAEVLSSTVSAAEEEHNHSSSSHSHPTTANITIATATAPPPKVIEKTNTNAPKKRKAEDVEAARRAAADEEAKKKKSKQ